MVEHHWDSEELSWSSVDSEDIVMDSDGDKNEHGKKGSGKARQWKGGTIFSESNCEFSSFKLLFCLRYVYWIVLFFSDLIQNTGIGHSYPTHDSLPAKAKMEVMDVFSFYK